MIAVTAAIIIKDKKVLIARRAAGEKHAGGWEFPGGKIDAEETPEVCLIRELKEELNIGVVVEDFIFESIYNYQDSKIRLLAYLTRLVEGDIFLIVHDEYKWVDSKEIFKYELLPADIPIAEKIIELGLI